MNSDTLAPTRKPRPAKAQAPAPAQGGWEKQFNTTRDAAVALLEAANDSDEANGTEIFYQLTRVAARLLAAATAKESPSPQEMDYTFYEVLSLIRACQLGGEDIGDTNLSLVRQAYEALHLLAVGEPSGMVWPEPVGKAPKPEAAPAAPTTAGGYTAEQLKSILETVAGRTRTLQQLIMLALGDDEPCMQSLSLDAACIIATGIGAMTDAAVGACIIGGHDEWNYGPLFAEAGKAVQA